MVRNNSCLGTARNNLMWDSVTGDILHIRFLCLHCTDSVQAKLLMLFSGGTEGYNSLFYESMSGEVLWVYSILLTKGHPVRAEQVRETENEREVETEKGQGEQ